MVILNPGRRTRKSRRRSRNSSRMTAPRGFFRKRHRSRRNAGFLAMNPGGLGSVTKGFSTSAITAAVPLAVGALANRYLQDRASAMIGSRIGVDLSHGWKNSLVGTLTSGALGFVPKYGATLFAGGMMQTAIKALLPYIPGYEDLKPLPPPPPPPAAPAGPTFSGLGRPWIPAYSDEMEHHAMPMHHPVAHPAHARMRGGKRALPAPAMHGIGDSEGGDYGDFVTGPELHEIGVE